MATKAKANVEEVMETAEVVEDQVTETETEVVEGEVVPEVKESLLGKVWKPVKKHGKKLLIGAGLLALGYIAGKKLSSGESEDDSTPLLEDSSDDVEVTEL